MQLPSWTRGLSRGAWRLRQKACENSGLRQGAAAALAVLPRSRVPESPPSPRSPGAARRLRRAAIGRSGRSLPLINPHTFKDSEPLWCHSAEGGMLGEEANSEMSRIALAAPCRIPCSARICIICHCAAGPPPLLPALNAGGERLFQLPSLHLESAAESLGERKSWKNQFSGRRMLVTPVPPPSPLPVSRCSKRLNKIPAREDFLVPTLVRSLLKSPGF